MQKQLHILTEKLSVRDGVIFSKFECECSYKRVCGDVVLLVLVRYCGNFYFNSRYCGFKTLGRFSLAHKHKYKHKHKHNISISKREHPRHKHKHKQKNEPTYLSYAVLTCA